MFVLPESLGFNCKLSLFQLFYFKYEFVLTHHQRVGQTLNVTVTVEASCAGIIFAA